MASILRTPHYFSAKAQSKHTSYGVFARALLQDPRAAELLWQHNALDMELYEWVKAKFEAALASATESEKQAERSGEEA